jgi:hypothetical protein
MSPLEINLVHQIPRGSDGDEMRLDRLPGARINNVYITVEDNYVQMACDMGRKQLV